MKLLLASLIMTLLSATAGVALCGPGLGGAFMLITLAALLTPIFTATREPNPLGPLGVFIGLAAVTLYFLLRETFDAGQVGQLVLLLAAFVAALAGATRLAIFARVEPTLASALVIAGAIAWLAWPIWISPHVTDELADRYVPVHPLLAFNGCAPQHGYWHQARLMYHLTNLGQDVNVPIAESVKEAVIAHAAIALASVIPPAAWRLARRRRSAAPVSAP